MVGIGEILYSFSLSLSLSIYIYIKLFSYYLANNFYISGVGQLAIKPMTYCQWMNELLWNRSEGGGSLLWFPEMLVPGMRKVAPQWELYIHHSDHPRNSVTAQTLAFRPRAHGFGETSDVSGLRLEWRAGIWTQLSTKGYALNPFPSPCGVSEESSLKADFISRVTLSFHPWFLSRKWGHNSGVVVLVVVNGWHLL